MVIQPVFYAFSATNDLLCLAAVNAIKAQIEGSKVSIRVCNVRMFTRKYMLTICTKQSVFLVGGYAASPWLFGYAPFVIYADANLIQLIQSGNYKHAWLSIISPSIGQMPRRTQNVFRIPT